MHLGQKISTISVVYFLSMIAVSILGWSTYTEKNTFSNEESVAVFGIVIGFTAIYFLYILSYYKKQLMIARCTESIAGVVEALGHSNIRVGEEWLINILVSYRGLEQEIKHLEPEFQFRYPQGSRIPLKFNLDRPEEVVVDYGVVRGEVEPVKDSTPVNSVFEASSENLQKIIMDASAAAINEVAGDTVAANAQVESLTESEEKGQYNVILQIFSDQHESPYKVVKQMKVPNNLIAKLIPGSFVQCRIDRADKNAVSLVFHDVSVDPH